jgi:hypothetical protein
LIPYGDVSLDAVVRLHLRFAGPLPTTRRRPPTRPRGTPRAASTARFCAHFLTRRENRSPRFSANLQAICAASEMTVHNIVKTTVFVTDRNLQPAFHSARLAVFGDHPASTVPFVWGLGEPHFVVEADAAAVA